MSADEFDLSEQLDKLRIAELVRVERLWRDRGEWDKLADAYIAESHVRTTWFSGTGKEFADASREMAERRSRHSKHLINPSEIRVNGDRALVESLGEIHNRDELDGIAVDTIQYCRFFSRLVRTSAGWKFSTFEGIYQKDVISPVYPGDVIPVDRDELAALRPSYRIWAYMLKRKGYEIPQNEDIVSEDRPDLVAAFYREAESWLAGAEAIAMSGAA
jgi:hypothetical protein